MAGGGNIKVVVRCRPLNARERSRGSEVLVRMEDGQTILDPPSSTSSPMRAGDRRQQVFSFDKSYWSAGSREDPEYASQETLYEDLGVEVLDHSFEGFNTCIFAYGQTGSGKSYSMMGYGRDKGIIPLTTQELFRRIEVERNKDVALQYSVEVSYIEIYNEKVRDLLNPKNKGNLKVREHPSLGPYVEDLSKLVVEDYSQMMTVMDEGNKARTVASTNMNETSSRSHAIFTVVLTQKRTDAETAMTGEKVSRISLVDLAGSERSASSGVTGARLRESANINKSLTTLGKVIAALAQQSDRKGKKRKEDFVPYRDSVLTWLLKESLGGNSKTTMIAAISPADYEETLRCESTLRYADAAKRIKTHAVVNEDPNAKLIRELKEELDSKYRLFSCLTSVLRSRVSSGIAGDAVSDTNTPLEQQMVTLQTKDGQTRTISKLELQDQLQASEKLMEELKLTWDEKMAATQAIHAAREEALADLGVTIDKNLVGVHAPQKYPSLVNLNEDPLMSECLVYQLKPGNTLAGSLDSPSAQVKLSGQHIMQEHCMFMNTDGEVTLESKPGALTFVNGKRVHADTNIRLRHGYRVILGDFHVFRFNDPAGVRAHRTRMSLAGTSVGLPDGGDEGTSQRSDSPAATELMDWTAARREVSDIEALGDEDLDKLFDDIVKVRTIRGLPGNRAEARSPLGAHDDEESVFADVSDKTRTGHRTRASYGGGTWDLADSPTPTKNGKAFHSLPGTPSKNGVDSLFDRQAVKQLRLLTQEMKRMRSQAAVANAQGQSTLEMEPWSAEDLIRARSAVNKWRRLRNFHMAEQMLLHAADVREANIIAKQMGKRTSYNFAITDGRTVSPKSAVDYAGDVVEHEDVLDSSAPVSGPRVVVRVLDYYSTAESSEQPSTQLAVYTWSLSRFQRQLALMRHVLEIKDRPNLSVHLSVHMPFGDSSPPNFSHVGAALVPLRLLARHVSYTVMAPIFCPYTLSRLGSCRVQFKCLPATAHSRTTSDARGSQVVAKPYNDTFSFVLSIDSVEGLTPDHFTEVHMQTRLSSMVGPEIAAEQMIASLPARLETGARPMVIRRTLSVRATSAMEEHFATEYATVEFFARVRPSYLEHLESFDNAKEADLQTPSSDTSAPSEGSRHPLRRNPSELTCVQHHDVLASVQIQEMGADGKYAPAEVEDVVVKLHQGVQRRIHISLNHASGQALQWTKLTVGSADNIRLVTNEGDPTTVPASPVNLHLHSHVTYQLDGTSNLAAGGSWDSAAHNCAQLDRRTPSNEYVIVRLKFFVDIASVDEPAVFAMDLRVRIIDREAPWFSFPSFWRPQPTTNVTAIFQVDLTPPLARSARDLWRLDTTNKQVPNEIILGDWRPRSITLVREYASCARARRFAADVQTTRAVLDHIGDIPGVNLEPTERDLLLQKVVDFWEEELDARVIFDVDHDTPEEEAVARRLRALVPEIASSLIPSVRLVVPNQTVIKQGSLALLRDTRQNRWEELVAILKPPYIYLCPDANKREIQIINVAHANVEASPDVDLLLQRRNTFKVFTITNSYIFQAASEQEMKEWITVIGRQR